MGLFLETLAIVAAHESKKLSYVVSDDLPEIAKRIRVTDELLPFAKLRLDDEANAKSEFEVELVVRRATARMAYETTPVSERSLQRLADVAAAQGAIFGSTATRAAIRAIADANITALFDDLNDANYHDEIAPWFRCGGRQEQEHRDGLSILYVANGNQNAVAEYRSGLADPFQTITEAMDYPAGVTIDKKGTLYVSNVSNSTVVEFAPGSLKPLKRQISKGLYEPAGIAYYPALLP
jgi:hypothetical protein